MTDDRQSCFPKTVVTGLCDDDVVQYPKAKNLCRFGQLFVGPAVGGAGLKVAGRVIVNENGGGGP